MLYITLNRVELIIGNGRWGLGVRWSLLAIQCKCFEYKFMSAQVAEASNV